MYVLSKNKKNITVFQMKIVFYHNFKKFIVHMYIAKDVLVFGLTSSCFVVCGIIKLVALI